MHRFRYPRMYIRDIRVYIRRETCRQQTRMRVYTHTNCLMVRTFFTPHHSTHYRMCSLTIECVLSHTRTQIAGWCARSLHHTTVPASRSQRLQTRQRYIECVLDRVCSLQNVFSIEFVLLIPASESQQLQTRQPCGAS